MAEDPGGVPRIASLQRLPGGRGRQLLARRVGQWRGHGDAEAQPRPQVPQHLAVAGPAPAESGVEPDDDVADAQPRGQNLFGERLGA